MSASSSPIKEANDAFVSAASRDWKHLEAAIPIVHHITKTVIQRLLKTQYM